MIASFQNVSIIGVGQMGNGIAKKIDQIGKLKSIFEINSELLNDFENRTDLNINNLENGLGDCNIHLFIVPSTKEIRNFLFDSDGINQITSGSVIVDLTTSNPEESIKLAEELKGYNIDYLDCGMTGGAQGAANGTLTLMIGGEKDTIQKAKSILESFTNKLVHVGKTGSGHAMKLIHNMVTHTIFLATVEGVRGAKELGIDPNIVIDVFNSGNARSFISEKRFPNHILSEKWDAKSRVSNLYKDLSMVTNTLNNLEIKCPFGNLTTALLKNAVDQGLSETDFSKLYLDYYKLINQ
ncbi:MAG: NAD(P)-dependent oxidoreductase [Alphaproteobacteria bacterium]|jgi:3-hydroxyisobutyrate dehydrogenase|nr:NAD(P)-dependent oxidoreductase [Alphaproteobacteria bacterium]